MRAVVLTGHGDIDQLIVDPCHAMPTIADGEVLIRVAACALNRHDVLTRRGMPGIAVPLPVIVGSDIAGEIVARAPDVTAWRAGQRVVVDPLLRDGHKFGLIGEVRNGGRAEYVSVPANSLVALPDEVESIAASALPIAYGTAHRMVKTIGRIAPGETVLVLGASGGVGVAVVQLSLRLGANVIACTSSDQKAERLRALGAAHTINCERVDLCEAVHEICGRPRRSGVGGVDVAVNATGGTTLIATQRCIRLGGRMLVCGATAGYRSEIDLRYLWTFEHQLMGSNGWETSDLSALVGLVASGELAPVVGHVLPLEQAREAETLLEDRACFGKVVLTP